MGAMDKFSFYHEKVLALILTGESGLCHSPLSLRCPLFVALAFCCRRIDDSAHFGNAVGRKSSLPGMLPDHLGIRSDVDAVDFVIGDVALHPLNLRTEVAQHGAGLLRNLLQLLGGETSRSRQFPLDDVLGHGVSPCPG